MRHQALTSILIGLLAFSVCAAGERPVDGPFLRAAQAPIDEAFDSVTSRDNMQDASIDWQYKLPPGFQAKRNSSYPWGTTSYGKNELWVGTIAQGWCVWPVQNLNFPIYLSTYQSEFTGCSAQGVLSSPSLIYIFDLEQGTHELIHEGTLSSGGKEFTEATLPHDEMSAFSIMGLRAAGSYGDLVFFAGHHLHGGDLVVFEGEGAARVLTKTGFGNPCANGVRNVEVIGERIFFATSTWCNLSHGAGFEFYEYRKELDHSAPRNGAAPWSLVRRGS